MIAKEWIVAKIKTLLHVLAKWMEGFGLGAASMSSATLSEPLFISWYEAIHSPICTKIRLFPSSNKREFVRYEIPTAKWLSNSKKRLSLLLHAVHEKNQLVWFLSAHPSSVLRLRMLAAAITVLQFCTIEFVFFLGTEKYSTTRFSLIFPRRIEDWVFLTWTLIHPFSTIILFARISRPWFSYFRA